MTEIDQKMKNYGYITGILSIVLAMLALFGPFGITISIVMVIIGLICSVFAVIKGDTGAKILGVIGLLMNLATAALALLLI